MTQPELEAIARAQAAAHGLDPALVCAMCEHESAGWNPLAIRYEPAFFKRYIHPKLADKPTTEEMGSAMSFGLMQVMGETAEEFGFKPKFPSYHNALCDPATGLEYGCRKLKRCLDRNNGDVRAALLTYNGGGNDQYDDLVLALYPKYQVANAAISVVS